MKCDECNYYWKDPHGEYPVCHWDSPWPSPCEEDDEEGIPDDFDGENEF